MKFNINGQEREISEETVTLAVEEYFKARPEKKKPTTFGPKEVRNTKVLVGVADSQIMLKTDQPHFILRDFMGGKYYYLLTQEAEELRDILQEAIDFVKNL